MREARSDVSNEIERRSSISRCTLDVTMEGKGGIIDMKG